MKTSPKNHLLGFLGLADLAHPRCLSPCSDDCFLTSWLAWLGRTKQFVIGWTESTQNAHDEVLSPGVSEWDLV